VKHFAGLDVSLEETAICVVDELGGAVREARVASEPEALVAFFRGLGLAMERIGLEACSLAAWLHEGLAAAGLPAVCVETRRAKAAMGAMPNKTDRNDARGLAQIVRTGWYRAVHVKSPACRSWRALLAARRLVLNKMRDVENGLRALLREAGLKLGRPARKEFAARVRELIGADAALSASAEPLLVVIAAMAGELAQLTRRVLDIARAEPVCRRPMGVPGVGPLTAIARRRRASRPDPEALPVRRDRRAGRDQPLRRRARQDRAPRGGALAAGPQPEVVRPARLGHAGGQTPGHGARPRRGRAQARLRPAPDVGR
jgi:transposase